MRIVTHSESEIGVVLTLNELANIVALLHYAGRAAKRSALESVGFSQTKGFLPYDDLRAAGEAKRLVEEMLNAYV
jgi:hypothetical protein